MKKTFRTAIICTLILGGATIASAQEIRGTWKGDSQVIDSFGNQRNGSAAFIINKQNGNLFSGYKLWFNKKNIVQKEGFTGSLGEDGSLYFAEFDDGYGLGKRTSKQTMTVHYQEDGTKAKSIIYTLERVRFTKGFVEVDLDGDEAVIRAEITNTYPLNAERIMKEADSNKDGKLSKKEWENWKEGK